jgi:hypothetical protein
MAALMADGVAPPGLGVVKGGGFLDELAEEAARLAKAPRGCWSREPDGALGSLRRHIVRAPGGLNARAQG